MGNQSSRSTTPTSSPQSPTSAGVVTGSSSSPSQAALPSQSQSQQSQSQQSQSHGQLPHSHYHTARRRESIQTLSTAKAQAAPPTARLENVQSHPTSTHPRSPGRSQSSSTAAHVASQLRAATDSFRPLSTDIMGNEQSTTKPGAPRERERDRDRERGKDKDKDKDKAHTPPQQLQPAPTPTPPPPPQLPASPNPPAKVQQPPIRSPQPQPQTQPVNVPATAQDIPPTKRTGPQDIVSSIDPADASHDYIPPSSHFSRPPRLPLPIEEEVHTPGSPILSPQDLSNAIEHGEVEGLPRRSSMLSTTTADDEDLGDEFREPSTGGPTVPTLIEWEGPGERVYVTGTFANWDRKYRLHHNGPSEKKDALSAYVYMTPGTHHVTFLVDNEMKTSDKMPSAVDYTNMLVNYVEVAMPVPPAPALAIKETPTAATPVQRDASSVVGAPQVVPPTPELEPIKAPVPAPPAPVLPEPPAPVVSEPAKKYHQNIPRYLLDLDAAEESSRFARANAMTSVLPTPPSLPGFLGKSILNGTTPMKDDSSVLIHPNHTVLNHLATSSIKDNILATSATTRYKQKFLTTIMYKPKEESVEHAY